MSVWNKAHVLRSHIIGSSIAVIAGISAVYLLVCYTGGIQFAYSHAMYLPVVVAGLLIGRSGGVIAGIVAGLILGPFMPLDAATGEAQDPVNWIFRLAVLTTVGYTVGIAATRFRNQRNDAQWIAGHDLESQLPNRFSLMQHLDSLAGPPFGMKWILAVIKITNVEEIAGTLDASAVDNLVGNILHRVRDILPDDARGFHWHSDELAIVSSVGSTPEDLLRQVLEELEEPFLLHGIPIHIEPVIGATVFETASRNDGLDIIREATVARRFAAGTLQNVSLYSPEVDKTSIESIALLGNLRDAIQRDQLEIHYQPQVSLTDGSICALEALIRWRDGDGAFIPPGAFIPRAENTSLIHPLTEWVLERVFTQSGLVDTGESPVPVAVNISPRNLEHPGFLSTLSRLMTDYEVQPHAIELEITESALMRQVDTIMRQLTSIRELGVTISLDDFGSGYSSLRYLQELPIGKLKIDKSFVSDITFSPSKQNIVQAAVHIARGRGWTIVAEGLEHAEEATMLRELGCHVGQGFLYSRALPAEDLSGLDYSVFQPLEAEDEA